MLSTFAFTCLTYCTGALSWFGPLFVENALRVRIEHQLDGFENDISENKYESLKYQFKSFSTRCVTFLYLSYKQSYHHFCKLGQN